MKKRTLEIEEDLAFQRREWLWQRIGMALLFLFVLGALFGAMGMGGPLSHGEAGERDGVLHVEYERVVRRGAPATLRIHLRPQGAGRLQLWMAASYFERVKVDAITPQPDSVSIEGGRHLYTFGAVDGDVTVSFEFEPRTIGRMAVEAGVVGGPSIQFSQIALF
jgi:hypothetical protein